MNEKELVNLLRILFFLERVIRIKVNVYRQIIKILRCFMCSHFASYVYTEHEIDKKTGGHIYYNNCAFREQGNSLEDLKYLLKKHDQI